jgi:hypothetical protein
VMVGVALGSVAVGVAVGVIGGGSLGVGTVWQ